jgi:AcrR family transcriptional regulator
VTKGDDTRREILGHALALASEVGLEALSIGLLAERVGMSKSGLFAHFSSKERLQVALLEEASQRFVAQVIAPALRAARGRPRVEALFERWLRWGTQREQLPGGCIFYAAGSELDDRPGAARDRLVAAQRDLQETLAQAVRIAKSEGHFRRDLDENQFVFEVFGIMHTCNFHQRLLHDPKAGTRAERAFARLLDDAAAPRAQKS